MVTEEEKRIGQELMKVLSRDREDTFKPKQISSELSDLLHKKVLVDIKYFRNGSFGNQNLEIIVISDNGKKDTLASFFLKAYPLENGRSNERIDRIDRGSGYYGYTWLKLLSESNLKEVLFLYGLGRQKQGDDEYNLVLLEDIRSHSLEKILLEEKDDGRKFHLLRDVIKSSVVDLHLNLDKLGGEYRYGRTLRKAEDYDKEFIQHFEFYLRNRNSPKLNDWEKDGKSRLYRAIGPICKAIEREEQHVIHLDLHPGNILDKIIDFNHIGVGPLQFDLVDLIKHPAVDWKGYDRRANKLVRVYLYELFIQMPAVDDIKVSESYYLNFLKIFYFSNIIRNMRDIGFSSWLRENDEQAYKERLKANPQYSKYKGWYWKDLNSVLNSLLDQRVSKRFSLSEEEIRSIKETRKLLKDYNR